MIQKSVRLEVPIFDGSRNPKDYTDWESDLESYFQWYKMDDDLCVEYAEARLGGQAKIFWKNEKEAARQPRDPPFTWAEMSRKLTDKYVPKLYMTHLMLCWMNLRQGKRKVSEDIVEFEEYRMRCKFVDSPQIQIAFFIHGLRQDLGTRVLEQNPATVDLAYSLVESNEFSTESIAAAALPTPRPASSAISAAPSRTTWTRNSGSAPRTTSTTPTPTAPAAPTTAPVPTPATSSALSTARAPNAPREPMQCFKCKGFGHQRSDCPSLMIMDIHGQPAEDQQDDDLEVDEYPGEDPDGDELDDPLGYIQITPIAPTATYPVATVDTREIGGSSSRPQIGGRTYKLMVDSGSCINGISEDMATRLGLPLIPHPTPYQVSWIDASTIPVKMQCYVPLKMSTYDERVLCDVLPMKIGSIILGRPWLFDHDVKLSGRANTCSFIYGGRRLVWYPSVRIPSLPTRSAPTVPCPTPTAIVTNGLIFRRELEDGDDPPPVCYAVALADGPTMPDHDVPPSEVFQLLQEYGFSGITVPITDILKSDKFEWTGMADQAFELLKKLMTEAPVLKLPDFSDVFEVSCDASGVGIGGVLSQRGHPIEYFSEKLNDTRKRYDNYDREFYALVQSLRHWRHYLLPKEFVLFSDHGALRHLHDQKKVSDRHARWITYLQDFTFVIRHKKGKDNVVADALSRRPTVLSIMTTQVLGFEKMKEDYTNCPDFSSFYSSITDASPNRSRDYFLEDGYLFNGKRLCIPRTSLRDFLIHEVHAGGLSGHFGVMKTIQALEEKIYWPSLKRDVGRFFPISLGKMSA
ncbi:uncharacterized protein LOC144706013 [Wolffia australiana]